MTNNPFLFEDTRYFWKLSKHIFRYSHLGDDDAYNGVHTINEGTSHSRTLQ